MFMTFETIAALVPVPVSIATATMAAWSYASFLGSIQQHQHSHNCDGAAAISTEIKGTTV